MQCGVGAVAPHGIQKAGVARLGVSTFRALVGASRAERLAETHRVEVRRAWGELKVKLKVEVKVKVEVEVKVEVKVIGTPHLGRGQGGGKG